MRKVTVFSEVRESWRFEIEVPDDASLEQIGEIAQEEANEQSDGTIYVPVIEVHDTLTDEILINDS